MDSNLKKEDVDLIRDIALSLDREKPGEALALMRLAAKLRPGGKLIRKKLNEMESRRASPEFYRWESASLEYRNTYRLADDPDVGKKYVISADINDIYSGLGCLLFVLAPAWKYAKKTGRILVIDWRSSPYLRDFPQNEPLFPAVRCSRAGKNWRFSDRK